MRFLYALLSTIWVMYAAVCYESMQWEPPYEIPWHAAQALKDTAPEIIDMEIQKLKVILDMEDLPDNEKAFGHFRLATMYWLKAYLQDGRRKQIGFLKIAKMEIEESIYLDSERTYYQYCLADLYHQLKEYDLAEPIYKDVIAQDPKNKLYRQRYQDLLVERDGGTD